jgi:hypothetical protein
MGTRSITQQWDFLMTVSGLTGRVRRAPLWKTSQSDKKSRRIFVKKLNQPSEEAGST